MTFLEIKARHWECTECGVVFLVDKPVNLHCRCKMGPMLHCEWSEARDDAGRWLCKFDECGNATKRRQAKIQCRRDPRHRLHGVPAPNAFRKLANVTKATVLHVFTGCQTCDDEEIQNRFAICEPCEYFNGRICTHKSCGCTIATDHRYFHKLGWKSQRCPVGKW